MAINYKGYFKEVKKDLDKAAKERIQEASIHVRNKVVEKLSGNGTGRTYRIPGTKKTYTASSPGQPPAVMMGDLRKSIQFDVEGKSGKVGSTLKKAVWMELGTKRMAARPFLGTTFKEEQENIKKILGKRWLK